MLDVKFVRENADIVKKNIKKKFQDHKLPLVDEVIDLDKKIRDLKLEGDNLRQERNQKSNDIGLLMRDKKIEEANKMKEQVVKINERLVVLEDEENKLNVALKEKMMIIPNIIAEDVPIGEDDSKNVDEEHFGDPIVPNYEIPYHSDIMASFNGLDKDAAGKVSGSGF